MFPSNLIENIGKTGAFSSQLALQYPTGRTRRCRKLVDGPCFPGSLHCQNSLCKTGEVPVANQRISPRRHASAGTVACNFETAPVGNRTVNPDLQKARFRRNRQQAEPCAKMCKAKFRVRDHFDPRKQRFGCIGKCHIPGGSMAVC